MAYNQSYFDAYHQIPAYRLTYPDENVIRFLTANFPWNERKHKKVLDLGCGSGRHLILLNELGFDAYGIDGSLQAIALSQKLVRQRGFPDQIRHGLITELPYDDAFFDGIIEHATLVNNSWEDILTACRECYRVLNSGGVGFFLLKTPKDCAFSAVLPTARHEYLIDEEIYMSKAVEEKLPPLLFHAFTKGDIHSMFRQFFTVRIHTWELSFKSLSINDLPGQRRTSYWIVVVRK